METHSMRKREIPVGVMPTGILFLTIPMRQSARCVLACMPPGDSCIGPTP